MARGTVLTLRATTAESGVAGHRDIAGRPLPLCRLSSVSSNLLVSEVLVVMHVFRCLAPCLVIVSLFVGCSDSPSAPTSPSAVVTTASALTADQLTGTWNLVSMQPSDQDVQLTPIGAEYTLSFAAGRLSTRADCNSCTATFMLSGQTLTAGPALACTRAACPTMAFENVYTRVLSGHSTVTVSATALVLSSDRGLLRFAR